MTSDEQKVRARYPESFSHNHMDGFWRVWARPSPGPQDELGRGRTQSGAWVDAAERLGEATENVGGNLIHQTTTVGGDGRYKALCTCGWTGPSGRATREDAFADAEAHRADRPSLLDPIEGQRLALLREQARTRSGYDAAWSDLQFLLHLFDKARAATMEEQ